MHKVENALQAARKAVCLLMAACLLTLGLPLAGLAPQEQAWAEYGSETSDYATVIVVNDDFNLDSGKHDWMVGDVLPAVPVVKTKKQRIAVDGAAVSMSSSDESVVAFGADGLPYAKAIGTATLTFSYAGNDTYEPCEYEVAVCVYGGKITDGNFTAYVTSTGEGGGQATCQIVRVETAAITDEGVLEIPATLSADGVDYQVTEVGLPAVWSASTSIIWGSTTLLKSLSFPSTLKAIDRSAFSCCSSLESISFGSGSALESIGDSAFYQCTSLPSLDLSGLSNLKEIGKFAFRECNSITSVALPEGLELIDNGAFYWCSKLASLELPASVTDLSPSAQSIFTSGVSASANYYGAFQKCTKLESVTIPAGSSLARMPQAFRDCTALVTVNSLANAQVEDLRGSFAGCTSYLGQIFVSAACAIDGETLSSGAESSESSTGYVHGSFSLAADCTRYKVGEYGELFDVQEGVLLWFPQGEAPAEYVMPEGIASIGYKGMYCQKTLEKITFTTASDTAYLGKLALQRCTNLKEVNFVDGAFGWIGEGALAYCTSLESLTIPALMSQEAYSDYYTDRGTERVYTSGFLGAKATTRDTVKTAAIGKYAFQGCTSLKTVLFKAGSDLGCYAIIDKQAYAFAQCDALESVAFEGRQPYWMNEDASIGIENQGSGFATYVYYLEAFDSYEGRPDFYYSVDYYLTKDAAQSDDGSKSGRVGRTEYVRGASTSAIATGDSEKLQGCTYSGAAYAEAGYEDGKVLDPNAVAAANGMEGSDWVWALEYPYGTYGDLSESCYAYLAHANDFSLAHAEAQQLTNMREPITANLSSAFDPARWFGENKYGELYSGAEDNVTSFRYTSTFNKTSYCSGGQYDNGRVRFNGSCYFTAGDSGLYEDIPVYGIDGTLLKEGDDYTLSFQSVSGTLSADGTSCELAYAPVTSFHKTGPYLMTVTSTGTKGYAKGDSFSTWILVEAHAGQATEHYADGAYNAVYQAQCVHGTKTSEWLNYSSAPYYVNVGTDDLTSSLIASGLAGLVDGGISIYKGTSSKLNNRPSISLSVGNKENLVSNGTYRYGQSSSDGTQHSPSQIANAVYKDLRDDEGTILGSEYESYSWSKTALLCSPAEAEDYIAVSGYAYAAGAPVFFTEEDGTVSSATLKLLADFEDIVVAASCDAISNEVIESIAEQTGAMASRVESVPGDACGLSIEMAKMAVEEGVATPGSVAVSSIEDVQYCIAALDAAGFEGGISLVSTGSADFKRALSFLYSMRDSVDSIYLFGASASNLSSDSFDALTEANDLWNYERDLPSVYDVGAGDTFLVDGVKYVLSGDSTVALEGTFICGQRDVAVGDVVSYAGEDYAVTSVPEGYRVPVTLDASVSSSTLIVNGTVTITGTVDFGPGIVKAISSDESVLKASVNEDGTVTVTGVGTGRKKVTVYTADDDRYAPASASFYFTVGTEELAGAEASCEDATYTGDELSPKVTVNKGDKELVEGVDYKVAFQDNVNVGQGKAVIEGLGGYVGTLEVNFNVLPATLAEPKAVTGLVYTGKALNGVKVDTGCVMKGNTATNVGTYTATVTPDANHVWADGTQTSKQVKYTIAKAAQTVKASKGTSKAVSYKKASKGTYKGKLAATKTVTAAQMKTKFGLSAKGTFVFKKANAKGGKKIVVASTGKVTIKKGLKKGTYKVKVKVTAEATANYKASAAKYVWLTVNVK